MVVYIHAISKVTMYKVRRDFGIVLVWEAVQHIPKRLPVYNKAENLLLFIEPGKG